LDITLTPLPRAELALAWERLPVASGLFNTSGLSYRAFWGQQGLVKEMEPEQAIDALSADGQTDPQTPFLISFRRLVAAVGFALILLPWSQSLVEASARKHQLIQLSNQGHWIPGAVDLAQVVSAEFLQQRAEQAAAAAQAPPVLQENRPVSSQKASRTPLQQVDLLVIRFLDPIPSAA